MTLDRSDRQALQASKEELTGEELEPRNSTSNQSRRRFLAIAGSAATAGLAGCMGGGSDNSGNGSSGEATGTASEGTSSANGGNGGGPGGNPSDPETAEMFRELSKYAISTEDLNDKYFARYIMRDHQSIREKEPRVLENKHFTKGVIDPENIRFSMTNDHKVGNPAVSIGIGYDRDRVNSLVNENGYEEIGSEDGFTLYQLPNGMVVGMKDQNTWIQGDKNKTNRVLENHDNQIGWNPESRKLLQHEEVGGDLYAIHTETLPPPNAANLGDDKEYKAHSRTTEILPEEETYHSIFYGLSQDGEITEADMGESHISGLIIDE